MQNGRRRGCVKSANICFPPCPFCPVFVFCFDAMLSTVSVGLTIQTFPSAIGRFRNLSLKLIDEGWIPMVADNVYVYHAGGSSIEDTRRLALAQAGESAMCTIHSAIRVHMAALSATEPEVLRQKRAWQDFDAAEAELWLEI